MAALLHLRPRHTTIQPEISATAVGIFDSILGLSSYCSCTSALGGGGEEKGKKEGKWLTLPPFTPPVDVSSVAKEIFGQGSVSKGEPTTALKWVLRSCPQLPMSLVQKLFRLRQVRKELINPPSASCPEIQAQQQRLRRVSAKEAMNSGDVIFLPITVQKPPSEKSDCFNNEDEMKYIRSLELYKDPAIIVVNKPPGMPVQGGVGIKQSMDSLAAAYLRYDSSESPRLVHRLDRDSSGILVLGRTQTTASILHSIFREKTSGALSDNAQRPLRRKYWALVIGTPKHSKGLISAPLAKVVVENGKSERVTIVNDTKFTSSQHALTEYKVIKSSSHGFTWLELCPLTGRKHQLRVHCAEALGTPIIGDYKYGWNAHRKWEPISSPKPESKHEQMPRLKLPFGLDLEGGSISEKQPRLHLHSRQMILPNVSIALQHLQSSSPNHDLTKLESLNLVAPLPSHMQMSWDILELFTFN